MQPPKPHPHPSPQTHNCARERSQALAPLTDRFWIFFDWGNAAGRSHDARRLGDLSDHMLHLHARGASKRATHSCEQECDAELTSFHERACAELPTCSANLLLRRYKLNLGRFMRDLANRL